MLCVSYVHRYLRRHEVILVPIEAQPDANDDNDGEI